MPPPTGDRSVELRNADRPGLAAGPALADPGDAKRARQMPGPAGIPVPTKECRAAFPGGRVTLGPVVAEGDLASALGTRTGRHAPAGTHVVGRTAHPFRPAGGRIAERWSVGWEWLAPLRRPARPSAYPLIGP